MQRRLVRFTTSRLPIEFYVLFYLSSGAKRDPPGFASRSDHDRAIPHFDTSLSKVMVIAQQLNQRRVFKKNGLHLRHGDTESAAGFVDYGHLPCKAAFQLFE